MSQSNEIQNIPVVAMRGVVIFPKMVMHFDVARPASMNAIYAAAESDRKVFLVAQKDVFVLSRRNNKDNKFSKVLFADSRIRRAAGIPVPDR